MSADSGRDVCAVLVSFHPDAALPRRVAAVAAQTGGAVLVDNGSDAGTLEMLRELAAADRRIEVIENRANLGVARALNLGAARAAERGFTWLLLLDQDSEVEPELVEALFTARAAFPDPERLALIGAGFEEPARRRPDHAAPASAAGADAAEDPPGGTLGLPPWQEVETAITSGSLLSVATYRRIGAFRDELFIDYVDVDYCRRARAAGYAIAITRRPLMAHAIGAPTAHRWLWLEKWTRNHSVDRQYYIARNDTVMLREGGRYPYGAWALKSLARRLRSAKRVLLYEDAKARKLAALGHGWWDGLRGHLGPRGTRAAPQ